MRLDLHLDQIAVFIQCLLAQVRQTAAGATLAPFRQVDLIGNDRKVRSLGTTMPGSAGGMTPRTFRGGARTSLLRWQRTAFLALLAEHAVLEILDLGLSEDQFLLQFCVLGLELLMLCFPVVRTPLKLNTFLFGDPDPLASERGCTRLFRRSWWLFWVG